MRIVLACLSILLVSPPAVAQDRPSVPRDQWSRVDDLFRELGVTAGSHVADVGAGQGFFTTRLATAVGPQGRVYAVDVNPVSLRELKNAIGDERPNVEIVRGDEDDPHLPADSLDAVLVVNAYHEFAEYRAMLAHLRAALRPGGRLVLVEPIPSRAEDTTREAQTRRHAIAIEFVEQDLREAGFEITKKDGGFITRPRPHTDDTTKRAPEPTDWLLVAVRPPGDGR
ncbi:MAG TPA: methyltransferase domain-containing protein [Vicinamibacterales bacterium]|nr:methyltransferase domain-containing protein [Vicinamibacterales bacterium]